MDSFMKKSKKILIAFCTVMLIVSMFYVTAYAAGSGDVAGAVEGTWKRRRSRLKLVVFPAIDLILAVFFFAKLGTAYLDYCKHGQFEWTAPVILFACLVFTLTVPLYIWSVVGM